MTRRHILVAAIISTLMAAMIIAMRTDPARQPPSVVWGRQFSPRGGDNTECITVDSAGEVFIGGAPPNTYGAATLRKYSSDGKFRWHRTYGRGRLPQLVTDPNTVYGSDPGFCLSTVALAGSLIWTEDSNDGFGFIQLITADRGGNLYATGVESHGLDTGMHYNYIAKLNRSGHLLWMSESSDSADFGEWYAPKGLQLDPRGNLCIAWYCSLADTERTSDPQHNEDGGLITLARPNGKIIWRVPCPLPGAMKLDHSGIYVGGSTFPYYDFDSSPSRFFTDRIIKYFRNRGVRDQQKLSGTNDAKIVKYDFNGKILWSRQLIDKDGATVQALQINESRELYALVTGRGLDQRSLVLYNRLVKLDRNGDILWSMDLPTKGETIYTSLAIDRQNDIYVCGHADSSIYAKHSGKPDVLLVKLKQRR